MVMRQVQQAVARALSTIRLAFRARLTGLDTAPRVQLVQADALAGERLQAAELFQHFGFTSAPPEGTQLIVLPLGGRTAHSVIVATEHGNYRMDVAQGEACIYNQWGARIHLKKDRIIEADCDHFRINAAQSITMQTKSWQATATEGATFASPTLAFGGMDGEQAQASINAHINTTGDITSQGDHVAGGISQRHHRHQGDSGGTSGEPE